MHWEFVQSNFIGHRKGVPIEMEVFLTVDVNPGKLQVLNGAATSPYSRGNEVMILRSGNRFSAHALGIAVLLLTSPVYASLNLSLQPSPDVLSGFIDVSYNSTTDLFGASGFAFELNDDGIGIPESIVGGAFDLNANINESGVLGSGTIALGGTVPGLGFNSGTLLTGTLVNFGFPSTGNPLEFVFSVTGGDAAGLFGPGPIGVILSDSGFEGNFTSSFDNRTGPYPGSAYADVAPVVPLPGSLWLSLAGIGVSLIFRPRAKA